MRASVFLTGGDGMDWALDEDLRMTRQAVKDVVTLTNLKACDVVHTMGWDGLARIPEALLSGKRIISHVPGEPFRYLHIPHYSRVARKIGRWIAQSTQAQHQLRSIGIESTLIPYTVDPEIFRPLPVHDPELVAVRKKWRLPEDAYLVGNFHRDTESRDLARPKRVKGPDIFAEIMHQLVRRGHPVHVILAGPRRHWLRRRLEALRVPYTFIGKVVADRDDYFDNLLPRPTLNLLYNLLDVYTITSRSEGGPRSLLEAVAAGCKVIGTPVGPGPDILQPQCIFKTPVEAIDILEQDITNDSLHNTIRRHQTRVREHHQPPAVRPLFAAVYSQWQEIEPYTPATAPRPDKWHHIQPAYARMALSSRVASTGRLKRLWRTRLRPGINYARRIWRQSRYSLQGDHSRFTIGLWHEFFKPPYGGGNQFMHAMRKGLRARGNRVVENLFHPDIDVYLLNAIHFDVEQLVAHSQLHQACIVHRIDGPMQLTRGYDQEKDALCYRLNTELAAASIIQSNWTYQQICETGYDPVHPVIIPNAADPEMFHANGRIPFDRNRKIRLVSTSWSDNPRKGGPMYKWIEAHLDWDRFEYTFVGRASEPFERIHQLAPVPSAELGEILRRHDIYITASQSDPCSNALIEALSCGLPALYLNDGGHPELVGYGGLPFDDVDDVLPQLDLLVEHYELFQNLIQVQTLDEVVEKYLSVMRLALENTG